MAQREKPEAGEKTLIKTTGFCSFGDNSQMAAVDVKDGKIIRIRPFYYDWKYKPEEYRAWKIESIDASKDVNVGDIELSKGK